MPYSARSKKIIIKESASMLVQFDSYEDCVAKGKMQSLYYKNPFEFKSLDQLLLIIDRVLDSVGFEKSPEDTHYLYEDNNDRSASFLNVNPEEAYVDEDILNNICNKDIFFNGEVVIYVLWRQYSSMQGKVLAGGQTVYFRSSLELLKMLYEFLEEKYVNCHASGGNCWQ